MKRFRAIVIFLAWTCSALLIVQTATASQGNGGKGQDAAVGIDTILLINPDHRRGDIRAEISGGGFLVGVYQTNASLTHDNDGHAAGENCVNPVSGSGVTDWFCCIGAGKWDGETPPGKRACDEAFRGSPLRPAG